jgi:hypothetical protein
LKVRGGNKAFFAGGLLKQAEPGGEHLFRVVVRHAAGFGIREIERMNERVGDKQ